MTIGWGKPINKLANAVGVDTKIELQEAPPMDVLDPGLPESLQKLTPEAKASLQKVRRVFVIFKRLGLCCLEGCWGWRRTGGMEGRRGGVVLPRNMCITLVVFAWTVASLQCPGGARWVFTDKTEGAGEGRGRAAANLYLLSYWRGRGQIGPTSSLDWTDVSIDPTLTGPVQPY